jgi:hypothetical protein
MVGTAELILEQNNGTLAGRRTLNMQADQRLMVSSRPIVRSTVGQ